MCGVIGYVGSHVTPEFIYNGLKRLEYRGYDSAGIALMNENGVFIERAEGKLHNLQNKLNKLPKNSFVGMGHTRWATHGRPSEQNAHPHQSGNIVLLHNGIIENYKQIKNFLLEQGFSFTSETDTEAALHLLNYEYLKQDNQLSAFEKMKNSIFNLTKQLKGAYAFGIVCTDVPDTLFVVKYGSPVVLGIGENENYMASGITALVEHTQKIIVMEDKEIAFLKKDSISLFDFDGKKIERKALEVNWSTTMLDKNGYPHFMLKEIHEEPQAVAQTILGKFDSVTGHININNLGFKNIHLNKIDRVQVIACGTSYYAGCLARYFIEKFSKLPVDVELASEYRYKTSTVTEKTLSVALSQSGETIDTLQAIKCAKDNKAKTFAVVNVPGSTIGHNCHDECLLHAGPEVGVASTKSLMAQVSLLLLLALALGQERKEIKKEQMISLLDEFVKIPSLIEKTLMLSGHIEKISTQFSDLQSVLFIGRGPQWAVALEGALKLKELSYIHAEGFAAGELKHGPIALIDDKQWVVCVAPKDTYYEKTISNIEEIRARGGKILAIGSEDDKELEKMSDVYISIPECSELIQPFLTIPPMHLLSYWVALKKGNDVDQPRNLAKSVTVE